MSISYIVAAHCTKCDNYQKATYDSGGTGHRAPEPCLKCGGVTESKMVEKNGPNDPRFKTDFVNIAYSENERWSIAMGVPAHQVDAFRERFPNSTYSDNGLLLIRNRPDKLRQMKERGFIEHR